MNVVQSRRFHSRLALRLNRRRYSQQEINHAAGFDRAGSGDVNLSRDEELNEQIEALQARFKDKVARHQAEFENFRSRSKREMAEFRRTSNASLIQSFLPVLDNFSRALGSSDASPESFVEGVRMIESQMQNMLNEFGIKKIDTTGDPFDPKLHEAVMTESSDSLPDNHVIEVLQPGYLLNDKLIRPAMVKVSHSE